MTIKQMIQGIVDAIQEEFGEGYPITTEYSEQDLQEPGFFVECIQPTRERFMGERYRRSFLMAVTYFPSDAGIANPAEPLAEIADVEERLLQCLDLITANGHKVRVTGKQGNVSDGVLVMTMTISMFERVVTEETKMETQTTNTTPTEGA